MSIEQDTSHGTDNSSLIQGLLPLRRGERENKSSDKIAVDEEHEGSKEKKAEIRELVCLYITPGARGWMWLQFLATYSICSVSAE